MDHLIAHKDRQMARVLQRRSYFFEIHSGVYHITFISHFITTQDAFYHSNSSLIFRSNYMTVICPKLQGGCFIFSILNNAKLIYAFVWITITCNSFLKQSTSWSQLKAWHIYEGVSVFVEPAALPHSNVWGDPGSKVEISHQKQSIKYAQFFLLCGTVLMVHGHVTKTTFLD